MRKTMVIPTYWCPGGGVEWKEGDGVFDHPTPLDKEGTLGRTLESMKILKERDFKLVILVCPTTDDIEDEVVAKVKNIIAKAKVSVETYIYTPKDLLDSLEILKGAGVYAKAFPLLDLKHYSNVRNVCLLCATILASEAVILIDDDEVFEIDDFVPRSVEFLGKRVYGDIVYGVAGYYLNKNDRYYDDVKNEAWMAYWDRFGAKARAFDKIIGSNPRIKRTPFVFGGAMIMHKELFHTVPFDPMVTRGEDIDYLINSRMYGFNFFLDNTLSIKHLPEPKSHPQWKRIREDIIRFVYEKAKITSQYETGNMVKISADEFDPYPGEFLKEDLEAKIYRSNMMLAMDYMSQGDTEGAREAMENIRIGKQDAIPDYHPFTRYREAQKHWAQVVKTVKENRYELRKLMEKNNLTSTEIVRDESHIRKITTGELVKAIRKTEFFESLTDDDCVRLAEVCEVKTFYEGEQVFASGDINDSVNLILKGKVSLTLPGEDETEVAILEKGGLIGESCLVHKAFRTNCTAREFTEFLSLPRERLEALVEKEPVTGNRVMKLFIGAMATKIYQSNRTIRDLMSSGRGEVDEGDYV